jgi:aconitate hydratase
MGVLPLQFKEGDSWRSLGLKGDETIAIHGVDKLTPRSEARMTIKAADGTSRDLSVLVRIDTADELDYYKHGGILQYVVRQLAAA